MARLGPAADHEFLFVDDLQLAPVGRAFARPVERIGVLGDQSFPAAGERAFVQRAAVAARQLAEAKDARKGTGLRTLYGDPSPHDTLEDRATFDQRPIAEIGA